MEPQMRKPVISVIIPSYQHAAEIPLCLESIVAQTFSDYQVIVVNDGSTTGTYEALRSCRARIGYVAQGTRGGNAARSRGWRDAKGDYLLFCDADVIMRPY